VSGLLLVSPYPPPADGIGAHTRMLAEALHERVDVAVAAPGAAAPTDAAGGVHRVLGRHDGAARAALLDRCRPDAVFVQFAIAAYGAALPGLDHLLRLARRRGIRVLTVFHEPQRDVAALPGVAAAIYRRVASFTRSVAGAITTDTVHAVPERAIRPVLARRPQVCRRCDARAVARAELPGRARLRVDVTPELDVSFASGPPPGPGTVVLRPVVLPGGLGPHKWRDRRLLEAHERDDPATMPLLVDADGRVLETSRASVVARARDGILYTPPADGRILPGTTLARTGARERALTLADLRAADGVYVASALRGLQPAVL